MSDGPEATEYSFAEMQGAGRLDAEFACRSRAPLLQKLRSRGTLVPLSETVEYVSSGHTPYKHDLSDGEIGFITVECVDALQLREDKLKRITKEQYKDEFKKNRAVENSLVCTIKRRICKAYPFVNEPERPLAMNQDVAFMIPKPGIRALYLAAYLSCSVGQSLARRQQTEQMNPYLSVENLSTLPVILASRVFQEYLEKVFITTQQKIKESRSLYAEAENLLLNELGLRGWKPQEENLTVKSLKASFGSTGRLDAEYYNPQYESLVNVLRNNFTIESIGNWGKVLKGRSLEYGDGDGIPVIRSGDLSDIESEEKFLRASRGQEMFLLKKGDVLISSIGFGSIGKVQVFDKPGNYATVSEVTVIRQERVNPYFLHFYLRSLAGQIQINRYITGATGQLHLYPKDVANILVPMVSEKLTSKLEGFFVKSRRLKKESKVMLEVVKRGVEIAVERDEAAALAWMEEQVRENGREET